jgi:hypothetical protein
LPGWCARNRATGHAGSARNARHIWNASRGILAAATAASGAWGSVGAADYISGTAPRKIAEAAALALRQQRRHDAIAHIRGQLGKAVRVDAGLQHPEILFLIHGHPPQTLTPAGS